MNADAKAALDRAELLKEQADELWYRLHDVQERVPMFAPTYARIQRLKRMCDRRGARRFFTTMRMLEIYLN